jgi:hypothetical protein
MSRENQEIMLNGMAKSSEHVRPLLLNEAKMARLGSELFAQEHPDTVKRYSDVMSFQEEEQEDEFAAEHHNKTPRSILQVDIGGIHNSIDLPDSLIRQANTAQDVAMLTIISENQLQGHRYFSRYCGLDAAASESGKTYRRTYAVQIKAG